MWVGNSIYFLSDRDHTVNLYSYSEDTKQITQLTHHTDFDIMAATAGADALAYEQAGYVHLLDLKTGQSHQLNIDVKGDFPWARPQMKRVGSMIADATLSPTGARAAFEARGDIFTVAADGSYRNITQSSGAHDRDPAWSPDGKRIAWFSDASGEFQLMIGDQAGESKPRAVAMPTSAYFSNPIWSPNAQQLLLRDTNAQLWAVAISTGRFTKIDADTYDDPGRGFDASWSPDSRWVAYSKSHAESHASDLFVLDGSREDVSGDRRNGGRHRSGVRCERQVSLLPREHELRAEVRMARHELARAPRAKKCLSRGAQCEGAVAAASKPRR